MAQSNMHKAKLKWPHFQSLLGLLTASVFSCAGIKIAVIIDEKLMIREILRKWHQFNFLGFLQHGSALLVKSTMPISCPKTFPANGQKIFWFLMEWLLNPKSQILGLSFRAPTALCWPK